MPPGPLSTAPTGGDRRQDAGDRPGHGAFSAMVAGRADASAGMLPRLDGAENAGKPTTEPEAAATGADVPGGHSDTPEPDRLIEVAVPEGPASPDAALPADRPAGASAASGPPDMHKWANMGATMSPTGSDGPQVRRAEDLSDLSVALPVDSVPVPFSTALPKVSGTPAADGSAQADLLDGMRKPDPAGRTRMQGSPMPAGGPPATVAAGNAHTEGPGKGQDAAHGLPAVPQDPARGDADPAAPTPTGRKGDAQRPMPTSAGHAGLVRIPASESDGAEPRPATLRRAASPDPTSRADHAPRTPAAAGMMQDRPESGIDATASPADPDTRVTDAFRSHAAERSRLGPQAAPSRHEGTALDMGRSHLPPTSDDLARPGGAVADASRDANGARLSTVPASTARATAEPVAAHGDRPAPADPSPDRSAQDRTGAASIGAAGIGAAGPGAALIGPPGSATRPDGTVFAPNLRQTGPARDLVSIATDGRVEVQRGTDDPFVASARPDKSPRAQVPAAPGMATSTRWIGGGAPARPPEVGAKFGLEQAAPGDAAMLAPSPGSGGTGSSIPASGTAGRRHVATDRAAYRRDTCPSRSPISAPERWRSRWTRPSWAASA
jgi:hypothetical protein